jgi:hypothetical protein
MGECEKKSTRMIDERSSTQGDVLINYIIVEHHDIVDRKMCHYIGGKVL